MAGSDFRRGGDNEQTLGKLVIGIFLACGEESPEPCWLMHSLVPGKSFHSRREALQEAQCFLLAQIPLLRECLRRLQGVNQVIKRVAIRVAHPSNLKFPVSGSAWRPGEGKGRMHSCLLIGPPLDSNFCLQKPEGGKGKGCLVPGLRQLCSPRMDMPPQMSQHLVGPLLTDVSSALFLGTLAQLLKSFIFLSFFFPTSRNVAVLEAVWGVRLCTLATADM